ncbi:PIG-L deacetylase family protein [Thermosynechococcus sp.]|uniref:PIG-L deacetylase family protein n=1 Tax=Thermosynechococcus sp. TaxID=2814275 RepID=UPI003918C69B
MKPATVLLVFAHPDDEVLGCGGTIAKLSEEGARVFTLILGEGITSRQSHREPNLVAKELADLKNSAFEANKRIGVDPEGVYLCHLPDNRFDTVPLLDIIKQIEKYIEKVHPTIIFTHSQYDLNIDHQITYKAVLTATRPQPSHPVKEIYACEVLSSTEWMYPQGFQPNMYSLLSEKHISAKIEALKCYSSEIRSYPHPRSIEGVECLAKWRGLQVGCNYAEAFQVVRRIL